MILSQWECDSIISLHNRIRNNNRCKQILPQIVQVIDHHWLEYVLYITYLGIYIFSLFLQLAHQWIDWCGLFPFVLHRVIAATKRFFAVAKRISLLACQIVTTYRRSAQRHVHESFVGRQDLRCSSVSPGGKFTHFLLATTRLPFVSKAVYGKYFRIFPYILYI